MIYEYKSDRGVKLSASKYARAAASSAAAGGWSGPATMQALLDAMPAPLIAKLSGHDLGLVMAAMYISGKNTEAALWAEIGDDVIAMNALRASGVS